MKTGKTAFWRAAGAGVAAIILAVLVAGCETTQTSPIDRIETTRFVVDGDRLLMSGDINPQTYRQFTAIMRAHPEIRVLVEGNMPGSLDDATMIRLGYAVRRRGLDTHLAAGSRIFSGAVYLFLAGRHRTMERGAVIGVHSWSDGAHDAAWYPPGATEHDETLNYVYDMLGSEDFYWFTIYAAPADGVHRMSMAEIGKYGLITSPSTGTKE
jgi:hypothetical protein